MNCAYCRGSGMPIGSTSRCPVCKGRGNLPDDRLRNPLCVYCKGTGMPIGSIEICPVCDGWGRLPPNDKESLPNAGPVVVFVEAGKPRKVHIELDSIFKDLGGEIRICDPYYGTGTLYRLDLLTHCKSILFLTQRPDAKEKAFLQKALTEFAKEHPIVEFRRHPGKELHDRFLLTDQELVILGHGLKDIGGADSFVVRLNRDWAADVISEVQQAFDAKWEKAEKLPS